MEWWFVVVYLTWHTQTVMIETHGPSTTQALCQRAQAHIETPTRSELIVVSPCFKKYVRESS